MGDFYRGGRDGGNRRPPKRRYRSEEEEGEHQRRPRYDREDALQRLRRETIQIAESPLVKIEDAVKNIAMAYISSVFESDEFRPGYLQCLHDLVTEQPFKIPFVATIVRVANAENAEAGKAVLDHMVEALQSYVNQGLFQQVKLMLRFFACLGDVLGELGIAPLLDEMIVKLESYKKEGDEGLVLELTYIILITMPYARVSESKFGDAEAKEMLARIAPYTEINHVMQAMYDPFSGNASPYRDTSGQGNHMVRVLYQNLDSALTTEVEDDFSGIKCLPTPWKDIAPVAGTEYPMPTLEFPEEFPIDKSQLQPEIYFSVFADQPIETVPPPSDLAGTIFRDTIVDTINILDCNRLSVSRFLIEIDCFYNPKSFIKRATPYDRVNEVAESADSDDPSTWKPEDVAVDAIFSQLFRLPTPCHKLVYYHSILTELCKLAPAAIAPSLGRAIRFMYRNLEIIDIELINRFVDWFSHHLSNFGYTWKWTEWSEHLNFPDVHPKKAFILGSLEKEIRLSFATRIKGTLPDAFRELISEEREKEQPVFKFDLDENPFKIAGKELLVAVSERKEDAEVEPLIAAIATAAAEAGLADEADPRKYARDAYITCICHIGAKSLSHVLSCIERCKDKLLSIGHEHPDARRQIVGSVLSYWKDQPGIGANVVDKLLNYSVVTPLSVIEWVLLDAGPEALAKTYAWEMVATTIHKVNNRVRQIVAAKSSVLGAEGVPEDQIAIFQATLKSAQDEQAEILAYVEKRLSELATFEDAGDEVDVESVAWIQWWAKGWLRAFRRMFEVTEGKADTVMAESS
ncbi:MIF4G like-domain-containing protein [Pyronema domesticum]|uniref:Similar to Nuclear cap-binding protein subunit 1 acc. no. O14253 n=1 Tax=Pyronema omphalodes (strain CBS 100304) TaxID=1076935 RepID=U4L4H6_PYROM|nr:MIF4G like-domain-containing protein [Pyronema domesticum]CCX07208.1 Similar to Nuclear cap-binding protein subunit 1; acc. no. O14253 [Pyronema omphalodes CBS 100304]